MGTPDSAVAYAGALLDFAGVEIAKLVRAYVPPDLAVLDVGAGWPKYRILLSEYTAMDAVEVWRYNIVSNQLHNFYRAVYHTDIADFSYPMRYGAVIMGDVLEHLPVERAQKVVRVACANADHVFVAVPFEMAQDAGDDNPYEVHVQDDLTIEVMAARYPRLKFLTRQEGQWGAPTKAIYVKNL